MVQKFVIMHKDAAISCKR